MTVKRPKCSACGTGNDVQLAARPGQIPGAAHAQRWICASCLCLEDHPDAARVEQARKSKVPQVETVAAVTDPARGPTTEELRARALAHELRTPLPAGEAVAALLLPRPCLACNREQGERMCDLCQRLEVAEASPLDSEGAERQ